MINYKQYGGKIYVSFDKRLRHNFKNNFKTATWNRNEVGWEINDNQRNINKLERWMGSVEDSGLMEELSKVDELAYDVDQLNRLSRSLAEQKKQVLNESKRLQKIISKNESKEQIIRQLKIEEDKLEKFRDAYQKETRKKEEFDQNLKEIVGGLIDIDAVLNARQEMIRLRNKAVGSFLYASEKQKYHKYQNDIAEANTILNDADWKSAGLTKLALLNCNRPERDNPADVTIDDIYNLQKI